MVGRNVSDSYLATWALNITLWQRIQRQGVTWLPSH